MALTLIITVMILCFKLTVNFYQPHNYAKAGQFPYEVGILDENNDLIGTGVIIDKSRVLTAANCFYDKKGAKRHKACCRVIAPSGGDKIGNVTFYNISKVGVHPQYNFNQLEYDLAMIGIENEFNFNGSTVKAVTVASRDYHIGSRCVTLGWSRNDLMGENLDYLDRSSFETYVPTSQKLRFAKNRIINQLECTKTYGFLESPYGVLCTYHKDFKDCQNNAGSPLICDGYLVGIASKLTLCGHRFPDMYTSVYPYRSWIETATLSSFKHLPGYINLFLTMWLILLLR